MSIIYYAANRLGIYMSLPLSSSVWIGTLDHSFFGVLQYSLLKRVLFVGPVSSKLNVLHVADNT